MNHAIQRSFGISLVMFFSFSATFLWGQLKGDTYAKAKASGAANWVLTYSEAPGFASNINGEMSGITVDLMEAFEKYVEARENILINMTYMAKDPDNFTLFLDEVKRSDGGVFGLSNTTITTAREKLYNFSPSYITNIGMILTNSSVPTLNDLGQIATVFNGMSAVTVKNSTNEKKILDIKSDYYPTLQIKYVSSFSKALSMVINDPKIFTNVDFTYYLDAMQQRKPVKRHPGGDDTAEVFGIIMPKSNDWAPLLKDFMDSEYLSSVKYKKIIVDNLGQSAMKFFTTLK